MPDISMCLNKKCPLHETCYRFNAKPTEPWQSYSGFEDPEKDKCFLSNKK